MTARPHQCLSALFGLIPAIAILISGCAGTAETVRPGPGQFSMTPTQDMLNEVIRPQAQQVVVVGDQFATGTEYGGLGATNWTFDLQRLIGQAGIDAYVRNFARGGTGYTPNKAVSATFSDDVRRGVNPDTDVVIVLGGSNDVESVPNLPDAVIRTLEEVKAIAPNAKIVVVGPIWSQPEPPPGQILAVNDAIKKSSEEFGAQFINPIGDNWFTGRDDLRGGDGIHPNDAAQPVIAERISPAIIASLRGVESVTTTSPTETTTLPETTETGTTETETTETETTETETTETETTETETDTTETSEPETTETPTPEAAEAVTTSAEAPPGPAPRTATRAAGTAGTTAWAGGLI